MFRFSLLLSSICCLFVLSWVLTRMFGPANCINSTLVGKVVINSGVEVLRTCEPAARLLDSLPSEVVTHSRLLQRLQRLEEVAPYVDSQQGFIALHIKTNMRKELLIQPQVITISEDYLYQPGLLEQAILFLKINNSNPLAASAVAQFLWQEFLSHDAKMEHGRLWLAELDTLSGYCSSNHVLPVHYTFCDARNEMSDSYISDEPAEAVPWSLLSTFSDVLRESYEAANFTQKKNILDNLMFLGEVEDTFIDDIPTNKDLKSLDHSFQRMLSDWLMPLTLDHEILQKSVGDQRLLQSTKADYVVVGRTSRNSFSFDFSRPEQLSQRQLIVESGINKYFFPSRVPFKTSRKDIFNEFQVQNVIYVSCEIPALENLLVYEGMVKRVLFVKQCSAEEIDWSQVAAQGIASYLKNNNGTQFVEFNLSALKFARRVRGPLSNSENFSAWQRWLLWQKIVNDDEPTVKRPLSAIEGVRRFRVF